MNCSKEIASLEERIKELKKLREVAVKLCDTVCDIEEEIAHIDEALPNPKRLSDIKSPEERKQLEKAEKLLKDAYSIIDEILGPPDETGQKKGTAEISLDEILGQFPFGGSGKGNPS